jgi:Zn-dependent protease
MNRNSVRVARIGGIDIYLHVSWLLAFVFITWSLGDFYATTFPTWGSGTAYLVGAISAILLFVTVLIHELAHSFTARANGLPVHTITLFIFGGVSNLTQEPQTAQIELLVAIAGPLASLVLAGIFYLLHAALGSAPSQVTAILGYLASVNLILALFNLIPGFPLDGGRVLRALIWLLTGNLRRATHIASNVGQIIGYLFIFGGLLEAFVLGQIISGIWLAFIGWFLQNAATASYQQTVMDRALLGVDVADVMDPPPPGSPPTVSVEQLAYHGMLAQNQRTIPIVDPDGKLRGIVTFGDLGKVPRERWASTSVIEILTPTRDLVTVAPDDDLRSALRLLAEHGYNQLPVLDNGRLVGMLNRNHVLQYLHLRQQLSDRGGPSSQTPNETRRVG